MYLYTGGNVRCRMKICLVYRHAIEHTDSSDRSLVHLSLKNSEGG